MDNWKNGSRICLYILLSMRVNIYSVYKTSRSCDLDYIIFGAQFLRKKIADIRVSKIPQRNMVNDL